VVIYSSEEMTMTYYVGLDVSVENTAICVIDAAGCVEKEFSARSHPDDLATALYPFSEAIGAIGAIGLEAGPMSAFLADGLKQRGLDSVLMETRRVHAALSAVPIKTDRRDARGIAELLRMGWFQPVHLKTPAARDLRLMLSARDAMAEEFTKLDKLVRDQSRNDDVCRRLMTIPGVGAVVAMTFRAAIDDPKRFRSSKSLGACFGLTPRRYQSGETDRVTSITKAGDASVRAALYEAAHVMLVRTNRWTPLKAWAMRVTARRGAKRTKIALARKLAVIMHRMWMDGTEFRIA
jgi:transposase